MKKRLVALLVAAAFVASLLAGAAGAGLIREIKAQIRQDFTVEIDGEVKQFKNAQGDAVYPILHNGTTYLPVRAIGELMGKEVRWHEAEKKVVLADKGTAPTVTDADVIVGGKSEAPKNEAPRADTSKFIGEDKAKQIALDRAGLTSGGAYFEKVELDFDNGVWHYEVEFKKNMTEYEAEIRADDGVILKWEVEKD